MNDDAELLRDYAENHSEAAFAELVRRHIGLVYRTALRQCGGDHHRAEDVAQSVFADFARKAASLVRHPSVVGWLYTSTRFAAGTAVRVEVHRQAREQEVHAMNTLGTQKDPTETPRLVAAIDIALGALPERDREAVLLRFFEGRPFAEIGRQFKISEDAARMRVERALERLRTQLRRHGITSTASILCAAIEAEAGAAVPAHVVASVTTAALCGSGIGSVTTTGLIFTMTKLQLGIGMTILVAATGGLIWQQHVNAELADEVASLNEVAHRNTALQQENRRLSEKLAQARAKAAETAQQGARTSQAHGGDTVTAAMNNSKPNSGQTTTAAFDRFVASNPKLQALYVRRAATQAILDNFPFFTRAKLTQAEIDAFEHALEKNAQAVIDTHVAAVTEGYDKNDPAAKKLVHDANSDLQTDLQAILGPDRYQQYLAYQESTRYRTVADSLATEMMYGSSPLTSQQSDQLTAIVASSIKAGGGKADWNYIVTQAQAILTPPQLHALTVREQLFDAAKGLATELETAPSPALTMSSDSSAPKH